MVMALGAAALAAAFPAAPRCAIAQARDEVRAELGVARIEQPGTLPRIAMVVSGIKHHGDTVLAALLSGAATFARDSVAAFQGAGALAWRPSARSAWQLEGGASIAAFALSNGFADANAAGWTRIRRALPAGVGLMAGAAYGYTTRAAGDAHSTAVEVGSSVSFGPLHLEAVASRSRTEDSLLMAASHAYAVPGKATLDVDDVVLGASVERGPLELAGTARMRRGAGGATAEQTAIYWTMTYAASSRYALVLGAGHLLADPVRGAPDASLVSAAMRFTYAEVREAPPASREAEAVVEPYADGNVLVVRVRAGANARVEVAGSFSGWEPVPIEFTGEAWEARIHIPSGRHRVAYRIAGGAWRAPANLGRLREFGGEVGLVVVP